MTVTLQLWSVGHTDSDYMRVADEMRRRGLFCEHKLYDMNDAQGRYIEPMLIVRHPDTQDVHVGAENILGRLDSIESLVTATSLI